MVERGRSCHEEGRRAHSRIAIVCACSFVAKEEDDDDDYAPYTAGSAPSARREIALKIAGVILE